MEFVLIRPFGTPLAHLVDLTTRLNVLEHATSNFLERHVAKFPPNPAIGLFGQLKVDVTVEVPVRQSVLVCGKSSWVGQSGHLKFPRWPCELAFINSEVIGILL